MALATRCPHCHTTFRVAHDQLKLRAGIVRCGACKQIFNGIEHLLPPDETAPSFVSHSRAAAGVTPTEPRIISPPVQDTAGILVIDLPEPSPAFTINSLDFDVPIESHLLNEIRSVMPSSPVAYSSVLKTGNTFMPTAFTKAECHLDEPPEPDRPPAEIASSETFQQEAGHTDSPESEHENQSMPDSPHDSVLDGEQSELSANQYPGEIDTAADEPGFIKKWRQQQRSGKAWRILMGVASVILLVGLLAQGGYVFRKQIAAWFPSMEPVLAQICAKFGCQLNLPAQITAVSIESSELQTLAASKNTFSLTLLLANHSQLTQAWPSIELTLNDANEQPVVRRIFMPNEYLASLPGAVNGISANTEQPVKFFFELAQLKASGYRVYLFYS